MHAVLLLSRCIVNLSVFYSCFDLREERTLKLDETLEINEIKIYLSVCKNIVCIIVLLLFRSGNSFWVNVDPPDPGFTKMMSVFKGQQTTTPIT